MSANHESKLYLVTKHDRDTMFPEAPIAAATLVFRTRKAARDYAAEKNRTTRARHIFVVRSAKWGPA